MQKKSFSKHWSNVKSERRTIKHAYGRVVQVYAELIVNISARYKD